MCVRGENHCEKDEKQVEKRRSGFRVDRFVGISTALTLRGPRNQTMFMCVPYNEPPPRYPLYIVVV